MSTNFWVSPMDKTVTVTMVQIMPYTEGRWVGGWLGAWVVGKIEERKAVRTRYCSLWVGGCVDRGGGF